MMQKSFSRVIVTLEKRFELTPLTILLRGIKFSKRRYIIALCVYSFTNNLFENLNLISAFSVSSRNYMRSQTVCFQTSFC
jgi:hypothetical protein